MWVSLDLGIVPFWNQDSMAPYIAICHKIFENEVLENELGQNGTALEGEFEEICECFKAWNNAIHASGVIRIYTTLKVNTRIDREQSFREKGPNWKPLYPPQV